MQEDWTSIKLDVAVEIPDVLDLTWLRGSGLQSNEELLPEADPPPPVYDEELLDELMKMGFPEEGCKRALYSTDNKSLGVALNWVLEHIGDSNFTNPFVPPGAGTFQFSLIAFEFATRILRSSFELLRNYTAHAYSETPSEFFVSFPRFHLYPRKVASELEI